MMDWGVYVHIPFCRQKCFYCDFPSFAGRESLMAEYTQALCREIAVQGSLLREKKLGPPATIYIGGGTPTALPLALLEKILTALQSAFGTPAEFTLEANPGTIVPGLFPLLRSRGVNRLSLGVQSFDDALLQRIGRIHRAADARQAVQDAQAAGFANISLDPMYGLPGQSMELLAGSVEQALALGVQHISIYGLQVEEGTVFARQQQAGTLELPSEEEAEAMYDYMTAVLPSAGYARYEISNFARPGFASRHNLSYWQDVPYLGLGAAAHSYWDDRRLENPAELDAYIACIAAGCPAGRPEEPATREIRMEEFCFLALRTARGIDKAAFAAKFGRLIDSVYHRPIAEMKRRGLLAEDESYLRLTPLGMKYGNIVFEAFLLEP